MYELHRRFRYPKVYGATAHSWSEKLKRFKDKLLVNEYQLTKFYAVLEILRTDLDDQTDSDSTGVYVARKALGFSGIMFPS